MLQSRYRVAARSDVKSGIYRCITKLQVCFPRFASAAQEWGLQGPMFTRLPRPQSRLRNPASLSLTRAAKPYANQNASQGLSPPSTTASRLNPTTTASHHRSFPCHQLLGLDASNILDLAPLFDYLAPTRQIPPTWSPSFGTSATPATSAILLSLL